MNKPSPLNLNDVLRLTFVVGTLITAFSVFFINPTLSTPMALAVVMTMLLSPLVTLLERQGLRRNAAIGIVFAIGFAFVITVGWWATSAALDEWDRFRERAPQYFIQTVERLKTLEASAKLRYPVIERFHPTETIIEWGQKTGRWFLVNAPALVGDFLTWLLLVPFVTFVLLQEGRRIRNGLFQLVPNRFFESSVMISSQVGRAISDYIRAKILEALIVGVLVTVGLWLVGAPYALVMGAIAGITNIIPYIGPVIGAVPAFLIVLSDPVYHLMLVPVALVYVIANVIDSVFVFPIFVAKIVNLHPLILIAAVIIGQQYYGLIGMLISIPIVAAIKVILMEFYWLIYKPVRKGFDDRRY